MSDVIINRVSESVLSTIDLEEFYPDEPVVVFDLKNYLFMQLILKEKDFREALKQTDWENYSGKLVTVTCSADAIIPMWAYMLVGSYLQPVASEVFYGTEKEVIEEIIIRNIRRLDLSGFNDKRVVIKGCGDKPVSEKAYLEITLRLRPIVKSIMYGEPCSTVPVFKKAQNNN
ncbi:MAG: DUF2480 family protein [Bacteroidota bacterium]